MSVEVSIRKGMGFCFLFLLGMPSVVCAQARCHAQLFQENPDYVEVTIDTRPMKSNVDLENVGVRVQFLDSNGRRIGERRYRFTDSKLLALQPGHAYRRYFEHAYGAAAAVRALPLIAGQSVEGGKADSSSLPPIVADPKPYQGTLPKLIGPRPKAKPST
jgi:hypothetical protein